MKQFLTSIMLLASYLAFSQDFSILKEQLAEEDLVSANKTIKKLLQKNPENACVLYWSGAVLHKTYLSQDLNSIKDLKPLVDAGISFEKAHFLDDNCLQETDGGHHLNLFYGTVFNSGASSFKKNEIEMAFTFFKMSKQTSEWLGKDDFESGYYAGHCANMLEDFTSADIFLSQAMKLEPSNLNALKAMVKCQNGLGEYAKSIELLNQALVDFPNDKFLWQELMLSSMGVGDDEKALSAAKTLSHIESSNSNTFAFLASLYDSAGNSEKALESYETCLNLNPSHVKATYNLGILLYNEGISLLNNAPSLEIKEAAMNKLKTSKEHLMMVKELDPTMVDVNEILNNIENIN